jgi:DNA repair exonuclease SbcCD ATPase subunit
MYYLEQIRLGNIRRFADAVQIPVSRGATIFLAPNGTGKTSLFEAIELSLTGQVRQSTTPLDFLIRDGFGNAFAESLFSGNIGCRGTLRKGELPEIEGNYDRLFPDIDRANLPYLLRLTHLLPQRGTDWLVQSNSDHAASMLDKLPIGRDAIRASGNMTKIKRGFTDLINVARKDFDEIEKALADWIALLAKKNSTLLQLQDELKPKEDTVRLLNNIIDRLKGIEALSIPDLTLLRAKCAELIKLLEIRLSNDRRQRESLASLENAPKEFKELTEKYSQSETALKLEQSTLTTSNNKHALLQKLLETQTAKLGEENAALLKIRQSEKLKADLQQTEKELIDLEAILRLSSETLQQLQRTHLTEQDKQQAEIQVQNANRQIEVAAEALLKESQEIAVSVDAANRWKELLTELTRLETERNRLGGELASLKERTTTLETERIENEKVHLAAVTQHDALLSASGAIKNAVATIAKHLPHDSTACPVCLAEYEPADLKARMDDALRRMQPGLDQANQTLLMAKQNLDKTVEGARVNSLTIANFEKNMSEVAAQIQTLQIELGSIRTTFAGTPSPEEAEQAAQKRAANNLEAMRQNTQDKLAAPLSMGASEWALLLDSVTQIAARIKDAEKEQRKISIDADKRRLRIPELKKNIENLRPPAGTLVNKEHTIRELEITLQKSNSDVQTSRQEVDMAQEAANRSTRQLSELKRNLDTLRARWTGAGLPNTPDTNAWETALKDTTQAISTGEADMTAVRQEEVELAKWVIAEEIHQVDIQLDQMRGKSSIPEFTQQLSASREECQTVLNTLQERQRALHDVADTLAGQLDQIQQYILTINTPWQELLNRVVLDPRFAKTTLHNFTYYRKQHAEVKVPLHDGEIDARLVASEAQITDLQFTFLLAMALNNQWSPWRALLLDDPTQHHDLVHASSVFDLLRDYIVDHQFQVLLATHDSVHAKFFLRKLQNDGIPVNFIELKAAPEGVIAESIST